MTGLTSKEDGYTHSKDASSNLNSREGIQFEVEPVTSGYELEHIDQHTAF